VELPWSEVTAISNEVTQYVLKDLNPGDQFEIQVLPLKNIFFNLLTSSNFAGFHGFQGPPSFNLYGIGIFYSLFYCGIMLFPDK
jgi:hypothetical protein